jgi:DNA-binding transcriptional MerR regulator
MAGIQPAVRIREAAARLGVSEATLRNYERAGLIPPATRNRAGQRVYEPEALETIRRVLVPARGGDRG